MKGIKHSQYGYCVICKRPLSRPESVARGMGPMCNARQARKELVEGTRDTHLAEPLVGGFIFQRKDGVLCTNVPVLVRHHSATGFEIGYGGSGPADLALNICELLLRRMGFKGETMKCAIEGKCFKMAWGMHQDFKQKFIVPLERYTGDKIDYEAAEIWVDTWTLVTLRGMEQGIFEYA